MPATLIVGNGRIGTVLARALDDGRALARESARGVADGSADAGLWALSGAPLTVVFAHGRDVNDRDFERDYAAILGSRLKPLERVAEALGPAVRRAVLVSSTAASLPDDGKASLPALQHAFERRFVELFGGVPTVVLRAGTLTGEGSQMLEGLRTLGRRSILLKRLRLSGRTDIPYCDERLLTAAVRAAVEADSHQRWVVAYPRGLDLNAELDAALPGGWTLTLPRPLFAALWSSMGVRPEFFQVSMEGLKREGWAFAPA